MKRLFAATALLGTATLLASGVALGQKYDFGKREYQANCAGCHGLKGKGDGPDKPWLTKSPADLTILARNNKGVLPVEQMYEAIDGRRSVPAHGRRDMPVWGAHYKQQGAASYLDVPYDTEEYVRVRLAALVDYVGRLQAK